MAVSRRDVLEAAGAGTTLADHIRREALKFRDELRPVGRGGGGPAAMTSA